MARLIDADNRIAEIKKIYGTHLRKVILYGSYARGDFKSDSDVDIMILLDISDVDLKAYSQQLSYMTYDYNLENDLDIKTFVWSNLKKISERKRTLCVIDYRLPNLT